MRQNDSLAIKTIQGTFWTYASAYLGKLLGFITTTILAWLLTKEDFGVAGYAIVVITFLDVLNDLGVGMALIYHREDPNRNYCSAAADTGFWLSLIGGVGLFALTWLGAPLVGAFFHDARAVPLTRVLALIFPLSGLYNVHGSLLQKELSFGKKFIPDTVQSAAKGLISIVLALQGAGAWSLVWGQVGGTLVSVIVYLWVYPWRPTFRFARRLAASLLSYGGGAILVNLLGIFILNVDYLFVGRYLGAVALGVYTLAFRVPELLIKQLCGMLGKVIFPVYARMRDDAHSLNRAFLATMQYVTLITVPLGLGLALTAEPFVLTFFSAKWAEAIPVMRAIAIYSLVLSLTFNAGDIFKAQGKLKVLTNLSLMRIAILVPALWWAVTKTNSIIAVGWAQAGVALIATCVNLLIIARMFHISWKEILTAFQPAALSGGLMSLAVWGTLILLADTSPVIQLMVEVFVGFIVYALSLWVWQRQLVSATRLMLKTALARR